MCGRMRAGANETHADVGLRKRLAMETRRVGGALGAEVSGVDLSQPLDAATRDGIREALLEHLVLYFRNQPMTPAQLTTLGAAFGTLNVHPFHQPIPDHDHVLEILKLPADSINIGGHWHTDVTFLEQPVMGSLLYAKEIPPTGGDTLFANTYLTYESLSPGMQAMLGRLRAVHSAGKSFGAGTSEPGDWNLRGVTSTAQDPRVQAEVEHPVVRNHPETGRKTLFVNPSFTIRFARMDEAESRPLLNYLCGLVTRPEFTFRLRWEQDMVTFLDNRCTQHYAINDYPGHRRLLHRVAINGERPV